MLTIALVILGTSAAKVAQFLLTRPAVVVTAIAVPASYALAMANCYTPSNGVDCNTVSWNTNGTYVPPTNCMVNHFAKIYTNLGPAITWGTGSYFQKTAICYEWYTCIDAESNAYDTNVGWGLITNNSYPPLTYYYQNGGGLCGGGSSGSSGTGKPGDQ